MKIFLVLLFLASSLFAADIDINALVSQLGNDDFDMREQAQAKLAELPIEYASKFISRSKVEEDPEIQWRLRNVAKGIVLRRLIYPSVKWRTLHGTLGVTGASVWTRYGEPLGFIAAATDIESDAHEKVKQYDVITAVDTEMGSVNDMTFTADEVYTVKIRRYKNTNFISEQSKIDPDDKDFEDLEVKIKAGWKDHREVSRKAEEIIIEKLWDEFLISIGDRAKPEASLNLKEKKTEKTEWEKAMFSVIDEQMAALRKLLF